MEDDCLPLDLLCGAVAAASNAMVDLLREGAEWVVFESFAWWVRVDPVSLSGSSAVSTIRGYLLPLAIIVAVAGVLWQGIRMMVSRKAAPLLDVGRGLLVLAFFTAGGVLLADQALTASDAFANWVLDNAADGEGLDRLVDLISFDAIASQGVVMILSIIVMVSGLLQAMLMVLREAALVVLAGTLVFAAAGQMTGATRPWLAKVLGWSLALIAYKPVAALVYASALALVGDAGDARTVIVGVMMMVLSLVALPALMKFFTWAVPGMTAGGGGGAAAIGAAGSVATVAVGMRAMSASQQATQVRADLGPVVGASAAPSGPAGPAGAASAAPPPPPAAAGAGARAAGASGSLAAAAPVAAGVATVAGAAKGVADAGASRLTDQG